MINIKQILTEDRGKATVTRGCLMAMVPENFCKLLHGFGNKIVKDENLYIKDGEFGREKECHVTVLFGFLPDLNELQVRRILQGQKKFFIELSSLSLFEQKHFDVVKFDVKSDTLTKLHEKSKQFPYESDFPDYHPHLTIAYVQPGTFPSEKKEMNIKIPINQICYSPAKGEKSYFELEGDLNEGTTNRNFDGEIDTLEKEWDRLDSMGNRSHEQIEINKKLEKLRKEKSKWENLYKSTI